MHQDRLGSATTITDHNGMPTAYRSYDPFGKPKGGDWSALPIPQHGANPFDSENITNRGFTEHEHLDEVELIHMNGRVYDYNVGRFMSVDPFVHGSGNSQGINPYSYIMNNPLSGTDPSGYKPDCDAGGDSDCTKDREKRDHREGKGGEWVTVYRSNGSNTENSKTNPKSTEIGAQGKIAADNDSADGTTPNGDPNGVIDPEIPGLYNVNKIKGIWIVTAATDSVDNEHAAINGMLNPPGYAVWLMGQHIDADFSNVTSYTLLYNPTGGLLADGWESLKDKMGFTTDISKFTATVLKETEASGRRVNWVAHSQGAAIFSEAVRYSKANLSNMRVNIHAGATNRWVTGRILSRSGIKIGRYRDHPFDPVPNIAGFNTLNPITIIRSLFQLKNVANGGPKESPHTLPYMGN